MASPVLYVLIFIAVVTLLVKWLIPLCERREMVAHEHTLTAIQAVYLFKNKAKPGLYTFRWENGRLSEPVCEKREGNKVLFRFISGERTSEKIQDMPIDFQRQLLILLKAGMRRGRK